MDRGSKLLLAGLVVLMAAGAPTRTGEGADPYLATVGPVQTWGEYIFQTVYTCKLWFDASQGEFEQCGSTNRIAALFPYPRPDGQLCSYYGLYMKCRSDLWITVNVGSALAADPGLWHTLSCRAIDVRNLGGSPLVRDFQRPLTCEQLERDFGGGGQ